MAKDPVCGMLVAEERAEWSTERDGEEWFFCCQSCLKKFEDDPGRYDGSSPAIDHGLVSIEPANTKHVVPQSTPIGTKNLYTCPMHPEILRDGPGSCPICGMALEPREVTDEEDNAELKSMALRLWVGTALTLPLLAVMLLDVLPGHGVEWLHSGWMGWVELALATPVVLWCGWPIPARRRAIHTTTQ